MGGPSGTRKWVLIGQRPKLLTKKFSNKDQQLQLQKLCRRSVLRIKPSLVLITAMTMYFMSVRGVKAETGYDCSAVENPVATFSLQDVAPCTPFKSAYKEPEATHVQILQKTSDSVISGFQCSLTISRLVCRVSFSK